MKSRHKQIRYSVCMLLLLLSVTQAQAQVRARRPPQGGRIAVVVDERLSVLRNSPSLTGKLLHRISRGRQVAILARKVSREGIVFYLVRLTTRTRGWMQREALVSAAVKSDDESLLRLIQSSQEFDRLTRAKIFLDTFRDSPLRPQVLLLYADAAESAAVRLSREAARRIDLHEAAGDGAPPFSYFLNYSGLDRYNRQGVRFVFEDLTRQFHYNGSAWRQILALHPHSPEASEARKRLASLVAISGKSAVYGTR